MITKKFQLAGVSTFALLLLAPVPVAPAADPAPGIPENFRAESLVAWCIVPFDAKKRSPAQRAEMLNDLGITRCAYDWRAEHVPAFEEEILAYQKHGIEFFAFWSSHESAFALFEKHKIHPQIWQTAPSPDAGTQEEKVARAVADLTPLAERTKKLGSKLGLYNHGGWGGEPENLVAVCKALKAAGHSHVGIVYNFHHAHGHIADFPAVFEILHPHLLCLNLNGMADDPKTEKILPVGSGKHERTMIHHVRESGYLGPIGILDHLPAQDAELSLRANLQGLEKILTP